MAQARYDEVFASVGPQNGQVSGAAARPVMEQSGLPVPQLRQIWTLADIDQDGYLDIDEFAVAMHLTREAKTTGVPLPATLAPDVIPPSKR